MKKLYINRTILYLLLPLILLSLVIALYKNNVTSVKAEETFIFGSNMEVFDFSENSPINALYYNDKIAFTTEDNSLWLYSDGEFIKYENLSNCNPIIQIRHLSGDVLIVNGHNALYLVDTSNTESSPEPLSISCERFDFNGNTLAIVSGTTIEKYTFSDGMLSSTTQTEVSVKNLTPICTTEEGDVYYVGTDSKLYKVGDVEPISGTLNGDVKTLSFKNGNLYATMNNKIYQLSLEEKQFVELSVKESSYELGNLSTPTDLSFKGDNLLISDTGNKCIQEFKVEDGVLVFTGFAVSKNKTAFNRFINPVNIDRTYNNLAVLDEFKFTLLDLNSFDKTESSYKNLLKEDFDGTLPSLFAIGKDTALLGFSDSLMYLDLKSLTFLDSISFSGIKDLCYQSGTYYVLTSDKVYSLKEKDTDLSEFQTLDSEYEHFTVNVFKELSFFEQKICSDLGGYVFSALAVNAKTFTLSFDSKEVYLIKENEEFISVSQDFDNFSLSEISIQEQDFVISDKNAKFEDLKVFTSKDNAYAIEKKENGLNFKYLKDTEEDLIFISSLSLTHSDKTVNLSLLTTPTDVLLVNDRNLTPKTPQTFDFPEKCFVTIKVNAYYLPVITMREEYALKDGEKITLKKGDEIFIENLLEINGRKYYQASFTKNDKTYSGYIPFEFTTETLSDAKTDKTYTVKKLHATKVYSNEDLTQEICELKEGTSVKILSTENGISFIEFTFEEGTRQGYVKSSLIIDDTLNYVERIISVMIILTCVFITTVFFITKKRTK